MKQDLVNHAKKRVWIVRHGRSAGNDNIKAYKEMPCTVLPLTKEGVQQGRDVGKFFVEAVQHFGWEHNFCPEVLASPFKRAHHTGELALECMAAHGLGKIHNGGITVLDNLHEQSMGILDGMSPGELKKADPEAYAEFKKHVDHEAMSWYCAPQGSSGSKSESGMDVCERLASVRRYVQLSKAQDIIIFAHGNTNRFLARVLLGEPWQWADQQTLCPNTAVRLLLGDQSMGGSFQDYGFVYEPFHPDVKPGRGGANFDGYEPHGDPTYLDRMKHLIRTGEDKHI